MSQLINNILRRITADYCRLSLVKNTDGFLDSDDVRSMLLQHGVEVVVGSRIAQRIHFELTFRCSSDNRKFIYLCEDCDSILPDMKAESMVVSFSISDMFPLFADKTLLRSLPFEIIDRLYATHASKRIQLSEAGAIVNAIASEIESSRRQSADSFIERLKAVKLDFGNNLSWILDVSTIVIEAIRAGVYSDVAPQVSDINNRFQTWLTESYFNLPNSSPQIRPQCVNKILPHIAANYSADDKVALLVVDGFTFWQYSVLRKHMVDAGLSIADSLTASWLPSITMLSRQAIFRGDAPDYSYKQNPANEKKLWFNYWQQKGFGIYEIQYLYDTDEFIIDSSTKRLAFVTVEMDEKMHSCTDYRDLLSLTENWCSRIITKIKAVVDAGFTLFLTTDHGSTLSHGWRRLSSAEKVFLYEDGSRGTRHLIYKDEVAKQNFAMQNNDLVMFGRDNWLCIRGNQCFESENKSMVTHGGSHFFEVLIPFIKITY